MNTTTTTIISIPSSSCSNPNLEEEVNDQKENEDRKNENNDENTNNNKVLIHQVVVDQQQEEEKGNCTISSPPYDNDIEDVDVEKGLQDDKDGKQQKGEHPGNFEGKEKQMICCPLTNRPLEDPVVHPKNGVSYERLALLKQQQQQQQQQQQEEEGIMGKDKYYPNRAVKEYLDPTTNPKIELQSYNPHQKKKGIFYCSITTDLLRDPVIDPEGNTYERSAIVEWIQDHGESPITRKPLKEADLIDNTTLLTILLHEIQQADDTLNPEEIQEWKKEVSNLSTNNNTSAANGSPSTVLEDPPLAALRLALQEPQPQPTVVDISDPTLSVSLQEEILHSSSSQQSPAAAADAAMDSIYHDVGTQTPIQQTQFTLTPEEEITLQLHEQQQRATSTARMLDENRRNRRQRYLCHFSMLVMLTLAIYVGFHWHNFVIVCCLVATGAWFGAVGIGCSPRGPPNTSLSSTLNSGIV